MTYTVLVETLNTARAALQRSDCKEPRYKWPTLLYFTLIDHGPARTCTPAEQACMLFA